MIGVSLVACAVDDVERDTDALDVELTTRTELVASELGTITASEAARELEQLYQDLAGRLEARGVEIEEMQQAVDAGDPERVRELFGFTAEELEAANARAQAVAAMVLHARGSPGEAHPDGLRCDWEILQCGFGPALVAWLNPAIGAGILVAAAVVCTASQCRWDDGSGPRTKQP